MPLEESREALKEALMGDSPKEGEELMGCFQNWFNDLKLWEAQDTFSQAFRDKRMTIRQVNIGGTARGGAFEVNKVKSDNPKVPVGRTKITLARGVGDIAARGVPKNFFDPVTKARMKNELGLHNLSASLLDPQRPISSQIKKYQEVVACFMPVPQEVDLRLFQLLKDMSKSGAIVGKEDEISAMRTRLTRIKRAQASDMGTKYVDVSQTDEPNIQYGITGTIIRERGTIGKAAKPDELANRTHNALNYKSILEEMVTTVNEIVMVYRSHPSPLFPMFACWSEVDKIYFVLDVNLEPTGMSVTDSGVYRAP